jgi:adenosylmethionine-8-amino-7-oxononanoate aminotransferase
VKKAGGLCIADEVMTGFGRTGKVFACDHLKNKPDLFCLSKGITGGFLPMGVTSVNEKVVKAFSAEEVEKIFFHGHSYTANPLACAAANASMKILLGSRTKSSIARITNRHLDFMKVFKAPESVADVRACGTILAIELKVDDAGYTSGIKDKIYKFFMERDILLRPLGNVIYVLPPYIITDVQLERIYSAIREFLVETEKVG